MSAATNPAGAPLTDADIQRIVNDGVKAGELSWIGFDKDALGFYTIPVLSKCHFQLAHLVARAALAQPAAALAVPAGWKLVPMKPTHEMVRASCDAMGATQAVMRAIAAAPEAPAQPAAAPLSDVSEEGYCPACQGSGEGLAMAGGGPEAYEVPCNCPHCNGTGSLADAYRGVVGLLSKERRKYLEACGAQFAAKQHLQTVQMQTEIIAALKEVNIILAASLKQADGKVDRLVNALEPLVTQAELSLDYRCTFLAALTKAYRALQEVATK